MKDSCISKMTITETRNWATQYKKIIDTLPALCVDKTYRCINDVFCTWSVLEEADFIPPYPNSDQWLNTYSIEIKTVNLNANQVQGTDERPPIIMFEQRTHVLDANLQKQLLSNFKQKSKIKPQKYSKFITDKKVLMTIVYG